MFPAGQIVSAGPLGVPVRPGIGEVGGFSVVSLIIIDFKLFLNVRRVSITLAVPRPELCFERKKC